MGRYRVQNGGWRYTGTTAQGWTSTGIKSSDSELVRRLPDPLDERSGVWLPGV